MFTPAAVAHFEASPRHPLCAELHSQRPYTCKNAIHVTCTLFQSLNSEQKVLFLDPPSWRKCWGCSSLLSSTTRRHAAAARGCQRSAARCRDRWGDQSTQNPFSLHGHAAMPIKTSVCATRVPQNREMATLAAQQKMRDYEARLGRLGVQVRAHRGCWEHMASTWARPDRVCAHACAGSATL